MIRCTGNGEARQELSIVLAAVPPRRVATAGQRVKPGPPGAASEIPGHAMDRSTRIRINDYIARKDSPTIT